MTTSKTEIAKQLHTMIERHLFGPGPWPMDYDTNGAVHQQLVEWGLIKMQGDSIHETELGVALDVSTWVIFVGHHDPFEIPQHLSARGFITDEEADDLMSRHGDDGEKLEDLLPPVLRRLYRPQGRLS